MLITRVAIQNLREILLHVHVSFVRRRNLLFVRRVVINAARLVRGLFVFLQCLELGVVLLVDRLYLESLSRGQTNALQEVA